jgi:hypothetical protein
VTQAVRKCKDEEGMKHKKRKRENIGRSDKQRKGKRDVKLK